MKKRKIARIAGLLGTAFGALAAFLAGDYATGAGLVGAALAGMSTVATESGVPS